MAWQCRMCREESRAKMADLVALRRAGHKVTVLDKARTCAPGEELEAFIKGLRDYGAEVSPEEWAELARMRTQKGPGRK